MIVGQSQVGDDQFHLLRRGERACCTTVRGCVQKQRTVLQEVQYSAVDSFHYSTHILFSPLTKQLTLLR